MLSEAKKAKVLELSSTAIYSQCTASLVLLLQNALETENNSKDPDYFTPPVAITKIQAFIRKNLFSLDEDLSLPVDQIIEKIDEANAHRKTVSELYKPIPTYAMQISMILNILKTEQKLRQASSEVVEYNMDESELDFNIFYDKCKNHLESMNEWEFTNCSKSIFKIMPMRMGKDLFYDTLKNNLVTGFKDENLSAINPILDSIKSMLTIKKEIDENIIYINVEEFLQNNLNLNPKKLTDDELEETINNIFEKYVNYVNSMEDILTCTLQDLSSLILFYSSELEFKSLAENPTHKDLYFTICQQLKKELTPLEMEAYCERIYEDLDEVIEIEIDKVLSAIEKKHKFMSKISDNEDFDEETRRILQLSTLINHYYFETLEDTLYEHITKENENNVSDEPISKDELEKLITEFLANIRDELSNLSAPLRKQQMQILRGVTSLNHDVDYVIDEIMNCIDSCSNFEQKLIMMEDLHDVFANYDKVLVDDIDEDEDEEDCGCGCGHHHHH